MATAPVVPKVPFIYSYLVVTSYITYIFISSMEYAVATISKGVARNQPTSDEIFLSVLI